ncbi:MAG: HNH endonuclease [Candidatus Binatia bacterium]
MNGPGTATEDCAHASDNRPEPEILEEVSSPLACELERLDELDAFELDAAMRRVRGAMQQRQSRLGAALGLFIDLRLHVQLGFSSGADYVRERLGMPDRTARDLVRVAQAAKSRSPLLAAAYARGELSWLRVLALLPVVRNWNAAAWTKRAAEVTLRRLADEVAWAAERIDLAPEFASAMPPAPGTDLSPIADDRRMCARGETPVGDYPSSDGDRQVCAPGEAGSDAVGLSGDPDRRMCARGETGDDAASPSGDADRQDNRQMDAPGAPADHAHGRSHDDFFGVIGRIHVSFEAPLSVGQFFRTVMQGFAHPTEPRWLAFERMLEQWRSQPRHRDPVFARDGYRCTAPACNSFRNLHDHHIVPRSAGGTNEMTNRTTLCAWHHLRAVHGGLATATGAAPDAIDWELGLAAGREPLLCSRGDRYTSAAR